MKIIYGNVKVNIKVARENETSHTRSCILIESGTCSLLPYSLEISKKFHSDLQFARITTRLQEK